MKRCVSQAMPGWKKSRVGRMPVNVGGIVKDVLRRAKVKKGQRFSFGGLLTRFLRGNQIKEEVVDYRPRVGPGFEEPLDDDDAIDEEKARVNPDLESDDNEDDSTMGEAALVPTDDED
ncbi:hypothetical protein HAX54_013507 [Datura stramonium]|uniref:Uncharacterized protein n=1 Tax=Datura stramonium TaxID=4076 RepID=A0ABS8TP17_DATST|nr:hypothetical protein [Datura stramonium]